MVIDWGKVPRSDGRVGVTQGLLFTGVFGRSGVGDGEANARAFFFSVRGAFFFRVVQSFVSTPKRGCFVEG